MIGELDARIPEGPIAEKWSQHKFDVKLVNPANKRRFEVIVVGSGLAGAAAAATLGELGYRVKLFTFHDTPRRAHSIAAQGGINAAKNYPNDGDSVYRLFYDTVKGGDFRAREGNVYRLAEVSVNIIDQCVAQGVPFAREYGGLLDNRSFGGAQVSRTFYARGQTGQQLLLGAYQALAHQVARGTVELFTRSEMLDLVVKDGRAAGIVTRDLTTGAVQSWSAHAVALCTGGYGNAYYLSTNAKASNVTAAWRAHKRGALFANPCFTQIHPTCIPRSDDFQSKLTLMSESLRNDGRVWIPKQLDDPRSPDQIPLDDRDYFLERRYPAFGNLVPRDVASRAIKTEVDAGRGVGPQKNGVYLDFQESIERLGQDVVEERYGNLFEMYERITDENPYQVPMRIYPAIHYTMGGLWVDYNLMSNVPGPVRARRGELRRPGRQPPRRQRADAGPGRRLLRAPVDHLRLPGTPARHRTGAGRRSCVQAGRGCRRRPDQAVHVGERQALRRPLPPRARQHPLGQLRHGAQPAVAGEGAHRHPRALREEFYADVKVPGSAATLNQSLEKAGRVADFLEFGELLCLDALTREESCGGHLRVEHQTEEGEALRDDEHFSHVAAWEFEGVGSAPTLHKEALEFEYVHLAQRSYK